MDVEVRCLGNRLDVDIGGRSIFFEVQGCDISRPPPLDFAIWVALPLAMRHGGRLHLRGVCDRATVENAQALSRIWSSWIPEIYQALDVTADGYVDDTGNAGGEDVILYSGGVDSTYALREEIGTGRLSAALTVHGMDYNFDDDDAIRALVDKTAPFIDRYRLKRIFVRTDAGKVVGNLGLTHGFLLAACLFIFKDQFRSGLIASDITPDQDFLIFPWGTNHITNTYFRSANFAMLTRSQEISRIQKLDKLRHDPIAFNALSFCGVKSMRPHNCGVCAKCTRTKAMLLALTGDCPDIFLSPGLTAKQVHEIDLSDNKVFVFYLDILSMAKERHTLESLPGLEERMAQEITARRHRMRRAKIFRKFGTVRKLRQMLGM